MEGGAGPDTILGGAGDDKFSGRGGNDFLLGERRGTTNSMAAVAPTFWSGGGGDKLSGDTGRDVLIGGNVTPIVVDRGNGLNLETRQYARHAVEHGYRVELKEPTSEWWQEIRVLLKYKQANRAALDEWSAHSTQGVAPCQDES